MTPTRPRVLLPFVGDRTGGSHRSALLLLQNLRDYAFEPVVVLHEEGAFGAHLTKLGITFRCIPLPDYVGAKAGWLSLLQAMALSTPRLRRFLKQERIDIVHTNDARMHLTWLLPARLTRCRMVWHQRTKFADWRLLRLAARWAHRIVCISDYGAGTVPQRVAHKTVRVPNPFETDTPAPDRTTARLQLLGELAAEPDAVIIGFVANITAQKRPMVFVEAAAKIAKTSARPCYFVVFGDDRQNLIAQIRDRAAQLNVASRFHYAGFRWDIEQSIAGCDLVLAPAVDEAFGRVLVEAMLVATPVIAADAGGHSEIIRNNENGWLVAPDDTQVLAEAVLTALKDDAGRERLAARAQAEARTKYSVAAHLEQISAVYESLLAFADNPAPANRTDVAFVISDLESGGSQRVVTTLANAWTQRGHAVSVITLAGRDKDFFALDPSVQRWVTGGQSNAASSLPSRVLATLARILKLRRLLQTMQPGSIISFILPTNILTVIAATGLPSRLVLSERNDPRRQFLGHHWNFLRRRLYRRAHVVTANSHGALDAMKSYVPASKLAFVPNPLPSGRSVIQKASKNGHTPTLLAVGRLHEQKGYDLLLEAFRQSVDMAENWQLRIIGDGPLRETLQAQAERAGIADRVHWEGRVADPFPYYDDAAVFVMPSRYEGTPNALLEAMSCGLPVVVSDASSGPLEYVENHVTGLVVPVEDASALAKAMDCLARDPDLRQRLAEAGRQRVATLSLDEVLPVWEQVIHLKDPSIQSGDNGV